MRRDSELDEEEEEDEEVVEAVRVLEEEAAESIVTTSSLAAFLSIVRMLEGAIGIGIQCGKLALSVSLEREAVRICGHSAHFI